VAGEPELGCFHFFIKNFPKPNLGKKYTEKYSRNTPTEYSQPEYIAALEYPYSTTKFALPSNRAGNSKSVEDTTPSQLPPLGPQTDLQSLIPAVNTSAGRFACQSPLCPDSDQIPQSTEMSRWANSCREQVLQKTAAEGQM